MDAVFLLLILIPLIRITENYDADTADVWFQLVVMVEFVFG